MCDGFWGWSGEGEDGGIMELLHPAVLQLGFGMTSNSPKTCLKKFPGFSLAVYEVPWMSHIRDYDRPNVSTLLVLV